MTRSNAPQGKAEATNVSRELKDRGKFGEIAARRFGGT